MTRSCCANLPPLLVFLLAAAAGTACSRQASPPAQAHAEPVAPPPSRAEPRAADASTPGETLAQADQLYASRLGATRGQFDDDRQIAVLEQEVLLYRQFLERAEGQPELEPAVRKGRERIADAEATIEFLRKHQRGDDAEPSPAEAE
jgi:hypothetical protein